MEVQGGSWCTLFLCQKLYHDTERSLTNRDQQHVQKKKSHGYVHWKAFLNFSRENLNTLFPVRKWAFDWRSPNQETDTSGISRMLMNVQNRAGIICCLLRLTPGTPSIRTPSCFYSSQFAERSFAWKQNNTQSLFPNGQRATCGATGRQSLEATWIRDCFLLLVGEKRENISKTRMCNKIRLRNVSHSWLPLKTEVKDFLPFIHKMSKQWVLLKEEKKKREKWKEGKKVVLLNLLISSQKCSSFIRVLKAKAIPAASAGAVVRPGSQPAKSANTVLNAFILSHWDKAWKA